MQKLLILLIKVYRYALSPVLGNHCRFYPSCSSYAEQALSEHGPIKGSWLAVRRLGRCHPWHEGGVDLVPEPGAVNKTASECSKSFIYKSNYGK
ncbi:MAG: membrane protein insertion efficiency factor YidD [Gammaproteobacteria bacterium]